MATFFLLRSKSSRSGPGDFNLAYSHGKTRKKSEAKMAKKNPQPFRLGVDGRFELGGGDFLEQLTGFLLLGFESVAENLAFDFRGQLSVVANKRV